MTVLDDLRTYLQMATGITEASTSKAREVVSSLLASGMALTSKAMPAPEMVGQVQELADDLVATSRSNRELLTGTIRAEVDKAVGRMGLVREDELAALRRHVQRLQTQVHELQEQVSGLAATRVRSAPGHETESASSASTSDTGPADAHSSTAPTGQATDSDPPAVKPKKKKIIVDPEAGA